MLSSWHGDDCCRWKGIGCDNVTGHVVMLDLASPYDQYLEAGNVNSSLLELEYLTHLDLSGNDFYWSPIPVFIGCMQRLSLNLSNNHLIGKIPNMIGNMTSLESFDVSTNQLSGTIPSSMSALTSLSHLNLSHNNFSGPVPTDNQFLTYDPSSYADNPYLCGFLLPNKCGYSHQVNGTTEFEDEDSNLDKLEKWLFYFVIFKASLTDSSNLLSSWHGHDCCQWEGIGCDNVTGHVVMLDLASPYEKCRRSVPQIEYMSEEYGELLSSECSPFSDQYLEATNVNSSLLELEYLTHLDLSGNDFYWSPIPMFIGSMQRLSYANNPYLCGFLLPNKCGYSHQVNGTTEFEDEDSNLDKLEKWLFYFVIFKASLNDSSNLLSSWHGHDCCRWEGIGCDNVTGHVVMLDLATPFAKCWRPMWEGEYWLRIDDNDNCDLLYNQYLEARNVNSSLLELEYLTHLDLRGNRFHSSPIPMFIGSMQRLRYLSLSAAGFGGRIPSNLGNLTNLHFLDLSRNEFSPDSNINWISHLSLLEHLNMMGSFIYNKSQVFVLTYYLDSWMVNNSWT
ncbi:hypothetical protein AHAS_Ahas10G0205000 [Arachis hypogaea]